MKKMLAIPILLSLSQCGSKGSNTLRANFPESVPFIAAEIREEINPVMLEEIQLNQKDIIQFRIKSITVKSNNPEMDRETVKWIHFNLDGTISEFKEHNNHKKFEYDYDDSQRLKTLKITDVTGAGSSGSKRIISLYYKQNAIIEQVVNEDVRTELSYKNQDYSTLLSKTVQRSGIIWTKTSNRYKNNRLMSSLFEKQEDFYHLKTFYYNKAGLLEKETYKAWDDFRDSTTYFYNEDRTRCLTKEGHFRTGQETGLFASTEDLIVYGKMNKWIAKYSFLKTGELYERNECVFNERNLLTSTLRYDYSGKTVKKTKSTYVYTYYSE